MPGRPRGPGQPAPTPAPGVLQIRRRPVAWHRCIDPKRISEQGRDCLYQVGNALAVHPRTVIGVPRKTYREAAPIVARRLVAPESVFMPELVQVGTRILDLESIALAEYSIIRNVRNNGELDRTLTLYLSQVTQPLRLRNLEADQVWKYLSDRSFQVDNNDQTQ